MKEIKAIIQPFMLSKVVDALKKIPIFQASRLPSFKGSAGKKEQAHTTG